MKKLLFILVVGIYWSGQCQMGSVQGLVTENGTPVPFVNLYLKETKKGASSDENGFYSIEKIEAGQYVLIASAIGMNLIARPLRSMPGKP